MMRQTLLAAVASLVTLGSCQQEVALSGLLSADERDLGQSYLDMSPDEYREAKRALPAYAWCVDWYIPEYTYHFPDARPKRYTSLSGAILFKQEGAGLDIEVLMKGKGFIEGDQYEVDVLSVEDTNASIDNTCRITGEPQTIAEDILHNRAEPDGVFPYTRYNVAYDPNGRNGGHRLDVHPGNEGGSDVSNRPRLLWVIVNEQDPSGQWHMVGCCPMRKTIGYLYDRTIKRSWKERETE